MERSVWFFSRSARSLAAMLSCTYFRATQRHSGKTVVRSSGSNRTCHPRLCRVIRSMLVATSPLRGSLVQHKRPPLREQYGGSTSSKFSDGGSASMVKMPGSRTWLK
ncbi:11.5 kDa early protein [Human adenovirus 41]|uniref:11.5 kDa early protein n=2 Tax=Human mastadenovirus F TaxID=130309 RepID=A0A7U3NI84_ADE41|nr:11.5 kDa early protein [Human adenovirus 41]QOV03210.1 11.5 kDa early protein [Human mastadenovirus F]